MVGLFCGGGAGKVRVFEGDSGVWVDGGSGPYHSEFGFAKIYLRFIR